MNSKKWETFYAVLLNIFVNCIAQEISCNEFGFFCADRIRFGNCIDYTNGTMSADVSFLIECPENTYCNIESVSICKEVTENTLQVSTTPSTGTYEVNPKSYVLLNYLRTNKTFVSSYSHDKMTDIPKHTTILKNNSSFVNFTDLFIKINNYYKLVQGREKDTEYTSVRLKETVKIVNYIIKIKNLFLNKYHRTNDSRSETSLIVQHILDVFKHIVSYFYRDSNFNRDNSINPHHNLTHLEGILERFDKEHNATHLNKYDNNLKHILYDLYEKRSFNISQDILRASQESIESDHKYLPKYSETSSERLKLLAALHKVADIIYQIKAENSSYLNEFYRGVDSSNKSNESKGLNLEKEHISRKYRKNSSEKSKESSEEYEPSRSKIDITVDEKLKELTEYITSLESQPDNITNMFNNINENILFRLKNDKNIINKYFTDKLTISNRNSLKEESDESLEPSEEHKIRKQDVSISNSKESISSQESSEESEESNEFKINKKVKKHNYTILNDNTIQLKSVLNKLYEMERRTLKSINLSSISSSKESAVTSKNISKETETPNESMETTKNKTIKKYKVSCNQTNSLDKLFKRVTEQSNFQLNSKDFKSTNASSQMKYANQFNNPQLTTSLKTENRSDLSLDLVHVLSKLNSILNGSNESKYSNDFSHSNTLDDSGDSEELDEDSDEDETEDSGNDSEDDNKSNDSSEFDESNNSD